MSILGFVLSPIVIILLVLLTPVVLFVLAGIRYVPNTRVGIIEKRLSRRGSVASGLIALDGEAGFQPHILRGGVHWLMPLQYVVHKVPLVTISQNKIGYVFARDGEALSPTQALARNTDARTFENAASFLRAGGQRGPQRQILREGTYAINLALFVVLTDERVNFLRLSRDDDAMFQEMARVIESRGGFDPVIIKGAEDRVGIVTVHDGPALESGEIIAPVVPPPNAGKPAHNTFQDPEAFLAAGGRRGRQAQVLVEGTYYINRLFATIEFIPKTVVDVGFVGVVVSYTGAKGADLSGTDYSHGELVRTGERGVWAEPLLPGKYAFNTYAGQVIMVPTTNFLLKWISSEAGEHGYDQHLAEVGLITKDAFEPTLPLSVVVHIDYRKAPLVIQRFGDIQRLVEQTLDPMVGAYFKNIGQVRTLIHLLQDRSAIQAQAALEMREKFARYNLDLEEVLIGTPKSPKGDTRIEQILEQLRARQVAQEQIETYGQQEKAAVKERELRETEARAGQQGKITESELAITVQSNQGRAEFQRSVQEAARIKTMAEAEGSRTRTLAEADAARIKQLAEADAQRAAQVGVAQAIAVEEQVRAYGGPVYQLTQQVMSRFAEAIQQSKVDVVPKVVVGGTGSGPGSGGSNVMEALLTMLLSDRMLTIAQSTPAPPTPEAAAVRERVMTTMRPAQGAQAPTTH